MPLSGTNIRLYSDVPFQSDYKHTRWFDDINSQTAWFQAKYLVHSVDQNNVFFNVDSSGSVYIPINRPIDQLYLASYIAFQNEAYNSKWFYAFVERLEYIQRNTTYVHIKLDVLQTWMFDMNFKPSYVVREHCPLWNPDGSPVVNTVDEGLNYGTEYDMVDVENIQPNGGYKWLVILAKNTMHNGSTGKVTPSVVGTPTPLAVYLLPFMDDDTVPQLIDTTGAGIVLSKPSQVLLNLYSDTNAVGNIVSLYITDYTGIKCTFASNTLTLDSSNQVIGAQIKDANNPSNFFNCLYVQKCKNFVPQDYTVNGVWQNYKPVTESKLLMYPYTQLVLDDFKGNRVVYKNEYIGNTNIVLNLKGSMGVSNKTSYSIADYNIGLSGLRPIVEDEKGLINSEPNDVPIIDNNLSAFIQGHKNTINNQKSSIYWNAGFDALGGAVGAMQGGAQGNMLNVAGAAVGAFRGLANAQIAINGIQAKQQDIANIPPNVQKMGSNTSYTIGNNFNGVFIIKKQIKDEYIKKLTDYFNMFGYKKNEVKVPNLHTRQNWNYVQTASCVITGNFNNEDLNAIKSVFDNGITLWHNDDVGNYGMTNGVL
jgi:hypothetical protein